MKQNLIDDQSPSLCRTFTFFYKDTRMINYSWMLIEGIFFHHRVVFALREITKWHSVIYGVGWTLPNIIMIIYGYVRFQLSEESDTCWTDDLSGYYEWIYVFFPTVCFIVSTLLLCLII